MASLTASFKSKGKQSPSPAEDHKRRDSSSVSRRSDPEPKHSESNTPKDHRPTAKDDDDQGSGAESVVSDDDDQVQKTTPKGHLRPMTRTSSAPAMKPGKDDSSPTAGAQVLPRKLSVAALIRSFSPRSRKKAQAAGGEGTETQAEAKEEELKPKKKSPVSFGKLKRSSLSFPASPPAASSNTTHTTQESAPARARAATQGSPASVSKWKQTIQAVTRDADRLRIQIPPIPSSSTSQEQPQPSRSPAAVTVVDPEFTSGPGSFVDDVRTTLTKLITTLDAIDPRKLNAIRLGGELRGLLGKAQDEFAAYEDAFRDHAGKVGVSIALQNFVASLHQVFPIVERLQTAKFMLNRQFKRDVTFAFQEINSYYTSMFMELSMSVAQNAGLVLPMPSPLKPVVEPPKPDEDEEEEEDEPPKPHEPTGDELCLTAHQHFFGHGCQVDLVRALDLYKQAASKECAIAKRCLGHMFMLGKGVEKDTFVAEKWLKEAASVGDIEAVYLLGILLYEKAPTQKTEALTRQFFTQAQLQFKVAAEHGHVESQYRLAALLESGDSSDGDRIEKSDRIQRAMPWYRRAAERSHSKSESALGRILLLHYEGKRDDITEEGTRNNATEAIHWLQRAATSGEDADALTLLGVIFSTGRWGTKRDVDRGVNFLRRAIAAGSYEAMLHLARLLLDPRGACEMNGSKAVSISSLPLHDREENHDEALRLLLTAAQCGGSVEANYEAGELLFNSTMLRDRAAALRFFAKAAESRPPHAIAARKAATMLYSGVGSKSVDKARAHRFYTIAAEADDAEALNALGLMYEDGEGCDLDFQKALGCYRRAVELGSAHAHFNLGCLLAHGKGVARNLDAAQAHFQRALALGYTLARDFLRPEG